MTESTIRGLPIKVRPNSENQTIVIHDHDMPLAQIVIGKTTENRVEVLVVFDSHEVDVSREKVFREQFPMEKLFYKG